MNARDENRRLYRVWIARVENWRPTRWNDLPPRAQAIEPAVAGCLTRDEAAQFVAGFNEATLADSPTPESTPNDSAPDDSTHADDSQDDTSRRITTNLWAIAVPVIARFDGDFAPGQTIDGEAPLCERFS